MYVCVYIYCILNHCEDSIPWSWIAYFWHRLEVSAFVTMWAVKLLWKNFVSLQCRKTGFSVIRIRNDDPALFSVLWALKWNRSEVSNLGLLQKPLRSFPNNICKPSLFPYLLSGVLETVCSFYAFEVIMIELICNLVSPSTKFISIFNQKTKIKAIM